MTGALKGYKASKIIDEVMGMSGFYPNGSYASSSNLDDKLAFFLLKRAARDIAKYRWEELVRTVELDISPNAPEQLMPEDFREYIPGTLRTIGDLRVVDFPAGFEVWGALESNVGLTGTQHRLRFKAGLLQSLINDPTIYKVRLEYISDYPVLKANGFDYIETFEDDNDIWLLDNELIIKGLKVKWSIEKRLDTLPADIADYKGYLKEMKGTQAGSKRINMGSRKPYTPSAPYTNLWKQ